MSDMKKTLEKMLEALLKNNKYIPALSNQQKAQALENVMQAFKHKKVDLNKLVMQKILAVALLNEVLKIRQPLLAMTLGPLLEPRPEHVAKNIEDLTKELKPMIERVLKALNKPEFGKVRSEKEIEELIEKLVQIFSRGFALTPNKKHLAEYEPFMDFLHLAQSLLILQSAKERDLAMDANRNVHGGIAPELAGTVLFPVQQIAASLETHTINGCKSGESYSLIDDLARYDGKADYSGSENFSKNTIKSLGGLMEELEIKIDMADGLTNWPPKPRNPFEIS